MNERFSRREFLTYIRRGSTISVLLSGVSMYNSWEAFNSKRELAAVIEEISERQITKRYTEFDKGKINPLNISTKISEAKAMFVLGLSGWLAYKLRAYEKFMIDIK